MPNDQPSAPKAAGPDGAEDEPLSIQAASRLLNVPTPTIRSWERRYGLPTGRRSPGGHRRYTLDDLVVLRRMRDEIAEGRSASAAAALATALVSATPLSAIDAIVEAARSLHPRRITKALDQTRELFGLDATVDDVLLPAMREVGRRWASGQYDVANEHAATSAILAWLGRVQLEAPPPTQPGTVVLSCGPRDFHTLGLESFAAVLRHRGVDCRTLGARTPVESLVSAVHQANAYGVVLVSHLPSGRAAAVSALRAVAETPARVYYAGDAFSSARSRAGVPGTHLGIRLARAADRVLADQPDPRSDGLTARDDTAARGEPPRPQQDPDGKQS